MKTRLILVGDAGYPETPVLELLVEWARKSPQVTTVVFLGDNVYPNGITANDSARTSARLQRQIDVVIKSKARGLFIPGNHDWGKGGRLDVLNRQASHVEKRLSDSSFLPAGGCPGPVVIRGDPTLVILDTQWWFSKKRAPCGSVVSEPREVADSLAGIMKSATGNMVILAHHPLVSYGNHGGAYDWRDIFFPLTRVNKRLWIPFPVFGVLYPLFRSYIVRPNQDVSSCTYGAVREAIGAALSAYNGGLPLIYVSGHDHSLQVIREQAGPAWFLVSGAGSRSKLTAVRLGRGSLFAHRNEGCMVLDYYGDDSILLRVVEPGKSAPVFCRRIR